MTNFSTQTLILNLTMQDSPVGGLSHHRCGYLHLPLPGELWTALSGGVLWDTDQHHVWHVWLDG